MPAAANRQIRLAARPRGLPTHEIWEHSVGPVPGLQDGQLLVKISHISVDPAMRGWLDDVRSYIPPVALGEVMRAIAAGQVVASRNPEFPEGTCVTGLFGVQQYAVSAGEGIRRIDTSRAPIPRYLGALGIAGLTAYFGMTDIGRPQPGDTVVVSGAAGGVGNVAGQIARLHGCRTIGIAGGPEKCQWLTGELGFDAAIDYKAGDVRRALRTAAPAGIDIYFDNVGGATLDAALAALRQRARVVLCGAVSQYNSTAPVAGPVNYLSLLINRASMTGMIIFDYEHRYSEATAHLLQWIEAGNIKTREHIIRGSIDRFPDTLLQLFAGANTGKLILQLT